MPPPANSSTSPWKMRKDEIIRELETAYDLPINRRWLLPELRQMLIEARKGTQDSNSVPDPMKGIARLSLAELTAQAKKEGIEVPAKATKGWLIHQLRESRATPADTVVPFGKFKGWLYRELPPGYLRWAVAEVKEKKEEAHPDLARLASWARQEMEQAPQSNPVTKNLVKDPEALATVPVPTLEELSEGRSSASTWSKVSSHPAPRPKAFHPAKRTSRRNDMETDAWADVGDAVAPEEEIKVLEARLAALKQRQSP